MRVFSQKPTLRQQSSLRATPPSTNVLSSVRDPLLLPSSHRADAANAARPLPHFSFDFSRIRVHAAPPATIQKKLMVNTPGDSFEQEADHVADQVMRMPEPRLQRACACGGSCDDCKKKQEPGSLQMKSVGGGDIGQTEAPPSVHEVSRSPGQPLDAATRAFMEPRFGMDFGGVRVHADSRAADSAGGLHAKAYTIGSNIVFANRQFAPATAEGKKLLAHELAHVAQQANGATAIQRQPDPPDDRHQTQMAGCKGLFADPGIIGIMKGIRVHSLIGEHFRKTVADSIAVGIPGAQAGPQRTDGLCGGPKPRINPQGFGKTSRRADVGIPDLARLTAGGILQVAEMKPAALQCLVDGEEQELRYINEGNAQDEGQKAWRASLGILTVSPMLEDAYQPPTMQWEFGPLIAELRTGWCSAGLLGYTVNLSARKGKDTDDQDQPQPRPPIVIPKPDIRIDPSDTPKPEPGVDERPDVGDGERTPSRPSRRPPAPPPQPFLRLPKGVDWTKVLAALAVIVALFARNALSRLAIWLGTTLGTLLKALGFTLGILAESGAAVAGGGPSTGGASGSAPGQSGEPGKAPDLHGPGSTQGTQGPMQPTKPMDKPGQRTGPAGSAPSHDSRPSQPQGSGPGQDKHASKKPSDTDSQRRQAPAKPGHTPDARQRGSAKPAGGRSTRGGKSGTAQLIGISVIEGLNLENVVVGKGYLVTHGVGKANEKHIFLRATSKVTKGKDTIVEFESLLECDHNGCDEGGNTYVVTHPYRPKGRAESVGRFESD